MARTADPTRLDVDTDRDNSITQKDEKDEDHWSKGPGSRGAIILPNADNDNGGNAPDNWSHRDWGTDFDGDGIPDPPNDVVDGNDDIDDIGPLWLTKLGLNDFPDDLKITLEVDKPQVDNAYFTPIDAKHRLRIFLPTNTNANDLEIQVGDQAIIGPEAGRKVEFVKTPAAFPNQSSYDIFKGSGIVKFGVEGIEFGAMVDIKVTLEIGGQPIAVDKVRLRVAPFVLLDHTTGVQTAYVTDNLNNNEPVDSPEYLDNSELVDAMDDHFLAANVVKDYGNDEWQQDGYEIGYVKVPYGQMPVVLELPRASRVDGIINKDLKIFIRKTLLAPGLGVNIRISGGFTTYDMGGNIESIPISGKPGLFFYGQSMSASHTEFFIAQNVNAPLPVNTNWLRVGHVDEVVSVAPNGTHVVVADPEVAWALLLWANDIDPTARMLQNMGYGPTGEAVGVGVANAQFRAFNFSTVMHSANLPSILEAVSEAMASEPQPPESKPDPNAGNTGNAKLDKGGALVGFFPNDNVRTFEIRFINATDYEVWYKEGAGAFVKDPHVGKIGIDEVFKDAKAFILKHWWTSDPMGTPVAPAEGDKFTFTADPTAKMVEMPVLFNDWVAPGTGKASAVTTDHVNSLVNGNSVITGKAFGPHVDFDGSGAKDILEEYASAMFTRAGYSNIIPPVDARIYHGGEGLVHCGTNVVRALPGFTWWNQ